MIKIDELVFNKDGDSIDIIPVGATSPVAARDTFKSTAEFHHALMNCINYSKCYYINNNITTRNPGSVWKGIPYKWSPSFMITDFSTKLMVGDSVIHYLINRPEQHEYYSNVIKHMEEQKLLWRKE
jgi:hypothetical protein